MAETISQYQVAPFTTPTNGTPADADQVKGNDNTVRTGLNSHDADSGIHFQSSTLANRPAAGTAGRKWYTTDEKKMYYDNGTGWDEVAYLAIAGTTASAISFVTSNASGLTLGASDAAGTIVLKTAGTSRWNVTSAGHLVPLLTNNYDIGASGTGIRNAYMTGGLYDASTGNKLVTAARQTGWTAATGTATRGTFATSTVTTAQLAEHVKALIDDLITHGLIGV